MFHSIVVPVCVTSTGFSMPAHPAFPHEHVMRKYGPDAIALAFSSARLIE
jgi:hypothetical protein